MLVRLVVVSYVPRKVLCIRNDEWSVLEMEYISGDVKEKANELVRRVLGISCNFLVDSDFILEEHGQTVKYLWMFTCREIFDKANLEYRWFSVDELPLSAKVVQRLQREINREVVILCDKEPYTNNAYSDKCVQTQNSKQAYSRVLPLKLLHPELTIDTPPNILDVFFMERILMKSYNTDDEFVLLDTDGYSWGIINMLPMILYRCEKVIMKKTPEGCKIGDRDIDLYMYVMGHYGTKIEHLDGDLHFSYEPYKHDIEVDLPYFGSFTATSMAVYFALMEQRTSVIKNASIEPEIQFLLDTVTKLGYGIQQSGRTITICGKRDHRVPLNQVIRIPCDRNALVTQIVAAAFEEREFWQTTDADISLDCLVQKFKEFGISLEVEGNNIRLLKQQRGKRYPKELVFGHHPALCTDWQPLLSLLCVENENDILIYDALFNKRFGIFEQLKAIYPGLEAHIFKYLAIIKNNIPGLRIENMQMKEFELQDIRAAAAISIALSKNCAFLLSNLDQLLRGYENMDQISATLGRRVKYAFR